MSTAPVPVFDGHNDLLLRLWASKGETTKAFIEGGTGHIDLKRARAGGFAGGLFAIFPPSPPASGGPSMREQMSQPSYDLPLPASLPLESGSRSTVEMAAILLRLARECDDVALCTSTADIRAAMAAGQIAAVMHIEGADGIGPGFELLDVLHTAGLRSIGPVWSRPNIFGAGVPLRFPGSPDTGPGLTDLGVELVRRCNGMGIMLDLSHLTEQGFWDVARTSSAPLVASHSNAHAISPAARNLTDRQLARIRESDGLVGLNFGTCFLRPDGQLDASTPLNTMLRHLDHLLVQLGEDRVGLGSDFDGALIPAAIGDAAGLPALIEAMRASDYGETLIAKIAHGNWLRVLEQTWLKAE